MAPQNHRGRRSHQLDHRAITPIPPTPPSHHPVVEAETPPSPPSAQGEGGGSGLFEAEWPKAPTPPVP